MKILQNIIDSYKHIPFTWKHKVKLIELEKQFTGKNTLRIILHDTDKLFFYVLFPYCGTRIAKKVHKFFNLHHKHSEDSYRSKETLKEIALDWESSRYTKDPNSLNARDFCIQKKPWLYKELKPILDGWRI